jgi:pyruvate carboxylase
MTACGGIKLRFVGFRPRRLWRGTQHFSPNLPTQTPPPLFLSLDNGSLPFVQFVGPSHKTILALGDKVSARKLAIKCNVPVVPGTEEPVEKFEDVKAFTDEYGFPIIIKAAFGGGGRGMRVVREQGTLKDNFERATSEAKSAFGDGTVFVERFLDKPKHIEVQLLGDNYGNVVHLYERDCSVQRRHQKVVEIAPAKDLPVETRDAILADAVRLAQSVNYRNAGTAEFLVDQNNRYYFIEINPRM